MIWDKKVTKEFKLTLSELEASQLEDVLDRAADWTNDDPLGIRYELEEKLQQALKDFANDRY